MTTTPQTGTGPVARGPVDDSTTRDAPSAAPGRRPAGSAAVPQPDIALTRSVYAITATLFGHRMASAVRTNWGWHIPTEGPGKRPEWIACDTTDAAVRAVHRLALQRAYRTSN